MLTSNSSSLIQSHFISGKNNGLTHLVHSSHRHGFQNMAKRARLLNNHAQRLNMIANEFSVAVVVANQMTTKVHPPSKPGEKSKSYLVPALGESWSHAITSRIVLSVLNETCRVKKRKHHSTQEEVFLRKANLVKSPSRPQQSVDFIVTKAGIRSLPKQSNKRQHD